MSVDDERDGISRSRGLLLGLAIVVATGAAIYLMRGDAAADGAAGDGAVYEIDVAPIVAHGRISGASWQTDEDEAFSRTPADSDSLIDSIDWGTFDEDPEKIAKRKEGLEKVVEDIEGLGVYVAPPEKDESDGDSKR